MCALEPARRMRGFPVAGKRSVCVAPVDISLSNTQKGVKSVGVNANVYSQRDWGGGGSGDGGVLNGVKERETMNAAHVDLEPPRLGNSGPLWSRLSERRGVGWVSISEAVHVVYVESQASE